MHIEFRFSGRYFILALLLLLAEVLIATVWKEWVWLRGSGGDIIAVIFLYALIKAFIKIPKIPLVLFVCAVAFLLETLQYFKLAGTLGIKKGDVLYILLGNTFSWEDIIYYSIGAVIILLIPRL